MDTNIFLWLNNNKEKELNVLLGRTIHSSMFTNPNASNTFCFIAHSRKYGSSGPSLAGTKYVRREGMEKKHFTAGLPETNIP